MIVYIFVYLFIFIIILFADMAHLSTQGLRPPFPLRGSGSYNVHPSPGSILLYLLPPRLRRERDS